MTTWFTSDLHYGHNFMSVLRGYGDDVDAHNNAVTDSLRQYVKPGDQLWILGDLVINHNRDFATACDELNSLTPFDSDEWPDLHLVFGNHDEGHPMHRRAPRLRWDYALTFDSIQPYATMRYNRKPFLLSHFPYPGTDHTEESRFDQYRLPDFGVPIVHGHTHSTEPLSFSAKGTPQIHVGWDTWRRPVELSEIHKFLEVEEYQARLEVEQ